MIRMFTLCSMALALMLALASSPLAQKRMPDDDTPKGKQLPMGDDEGDEEGEEVEEEVDPQTDGHEAESFELKHLWLADTTYTLILDTSMYTTTVREDDDDRKSLSGTTAALQIAITKLDEESGEVLAYSVEIIECVARRGYAYGDEEMEIESDDSKLNEFEGEFERESVDGDWSVTIIQPDDDELAGDLESAVKAFFLRLCALPMALTRSESTEVEEEWEIDSSHCADQMLSVLHWMGEIDEDAEISITATEYDGNAVFDGYEEAVDPAEVEDGPREEAYEEEEEAAFEPEKNAFISGVHVGTLEVIFGDRTLLLEGEGEELTMLDMLNDRLIANTFSYTASGSMLGDNGELRYMGELQADQTAMLFVGEAEAVIEDQDLAELFETTEEAEGDDEGGFAEPEGEME